MQRHTPFVGHGQKKEAWERVAAYVRAHGGRDLQKANYLLCMRRYEALKKEFNQQEAESRRASGVTETVRRQDELLMDLVQKEADFDEQRQRQNQNDEDDFTAGTVDEFQGHINRQESIRIMDAPSTSSSAPSAATSSSVDPVLSSSDSSASSSSRNVSSSTPGSATRASVRFNPHTRPAQRAQAPRSSTVEKKMIELMVNINGLVSDVRKFMYVHSAA